MMNGNVPNKKNCVKKFIKIQYLEFWWKNQVQIQDIAKKMVSWIFNSISFNIFYIGSFIWCISLHNQKYLSAREKKESWPRPGYSTLVAVPQFQQENEIIFSWRPFVQYILIILMSIVFNFETFFIKYVLFVGNGKRNLVWIKLCKIILISSNLIMYLCILPNNGTLLTV